jgi:hypothetical protein
MKKIKKIIIFSCLIGLTVITACSSEDPTQPSDTIDKQVLSKVVAVGNSLTAGVQSSGLVDEFQMNSYPYLIAKQIGKAGEFQQPLISPPGVAEIDTSTGVVYGPLKFENGQVVKGDLVPGGIAGIPALLTNASLLRAYDNLGLPGADLNDILTATGGGFFDAILRNPYFGNTTALEQAKSLNPTLILLWIGNNDILGAALVGGDPSQITSISDFRSRYISIIAELSTIRDGKVVLVMADIPDVSDIPYVNLLDNLIYRAIPALGINTPVPVVFNSSFQPILFDTTTALYLPLITEESLTEVSHVLLPFLAEYWARGLGIPDSATLVDFGLSDDLVSTLVKRMLEEDLKMSGQPIPGSLTLTNMENAMIEMAVTNFNQVIFELTQQNENLFVNANALLKLLNTTGIDGYNGKFVYFDQANTAFSLDGVHPNNGGYALIANEFIKVMNQFLNTGVPELNTAEFKGQYMGISLNKSLAFKASLQVKDMFIRNKK